MPRAKHFLIPVDGYVRVSRTGDREGESFIAPDVQRGHIESWAASRGFRLLEVFVELDESGARADRPLLSKALARIESGVSRGLVVSRVSRFGRSHVDGVMQVERVRRAGGEFYSVQDGLDTSTPTGRLVLRIMLSMAESELERVREDWMAAKTYAVRRGVWVASSVPVGYVKTPTGRLEVDPRSGPIMAEAFRRRAAGDSLRQIARYLESQSVRTGHGNPGWIPTTVSHVLSHRAYLGENSLGRAVNRTAHPPITDPSTFAMAQETRRITPRGRRNTGDSCDLFKGLVRCASCGLTMTVVTPTNGHRHYICRKESAAGRCAAPAAIVTARLDPYVLDAFFRLLARRRHPSRGAVLAAQATVEDLQGDLTRYRDNDRLVRALGDDTFAAGVETRVRRLHSATLRLAAAQERLAAHELPSARQLRATWATVDLADQRKMIRQVIDCAYVAPGRGHVEHRVTVCPRGTAPAYGFRGVGPGNSVVALQPNRRWINPTAGPSGRRTLIPRRRPSYAELPPPWLNAWITRRNRASSPST